MTTWKLETAKARFSELVRSARMTGPQEVTVRGVTAVYVVAADDFRRSGTRADTTKDIVERLRAATGGLELNFERDETDRRDDRTMSEL